MDPNKHDYIEMIYQVTMQRDSPYYRQFGEKMLRLVRSLRSDFDLSGFELGTSLYTLMIKRTDTNWGILFIFWDDSAFKLSNKQEQQMTWLVVPEENILAAIQARLDEVRAEMQEK